MLHIYIYIYIYDISRLRVNRRYFFYSIYRLTFIVLRLADTAALTWPVLSSIILSLTTLTGLSRVLPEKLAVAHLDNKIPRLSWSPKIRHCVHKTSPLERILSQMNPLYTSPPNLLMFNFKINLDRAGIINGVHGSVHRNINLMERTNKMQPCSRIYYSNVS